MFTFRRVFAFWAALVAITVVGRVHAQTTTSSATLKITKTGVTHTTSRGSNNRGLTQINYADCANDDVMTFPLVVAGFSMYTLQVWAGTNCTDVATRTSSTQRTCWLVESTAIQTNSNSYSLPLHVSSLVAGYTTLFGTNACATTSTGTAGSSSGGASSGGNGGDTSSGGATSSGSVAIGQKIEPNPSYCEQPCPKNVQGPTTINVFFMLVNTSDNSVAASDSWQGTFKLVGPQPPDKVSTGVGGNLLVVNFSYSSATGTSSDTSASGFNIYCDPSPGSAAAADAGLLDPDGGPIVGNCGDNPPKVLFANDPVPDGKYLCGSVQATTTQSANATKLVNGLPYNVAVAAFDSYDNNGPLSQVTCGIPQEINGFFKGYRDAGGRGGGGFCSFSRKPEPLTLVTLLGLASVLVFRRRRAA